MLGFSNGPTRHQTLNILAVIWKRIFWKHSITATHTSMFPLLLSANVQWFFLPYGGGSTHILKSFMCFCCKRLCCQISAHITSNLLFHIHFKLPYYKDEKKNVNDIVHFGQFTKCLNIAKLNLCIWTVLNLLSTVLLIMYA